MVSAGIAQSGPNTDAARAFSRLCLDFSKAVSHIGSFCSSAPRRCRFERHRKKSGRASDLLVSLGRRQQQKVVLAARHGFVKKTSYVQNRKWEGQTQGLGLVARLECKYSNLFILSPFKLKTLQPRRSVMLDLRLN